MRLRTKAYRPSRNTYAKAFVTARSYAESLPIPLFVAVGARTFATLVLVHLQAPLFLQVAHALLFSFVGFFVLRNINSSRGKKARALLSEGAGHKTGDDLLSHSSVAALPSAIEGLTSVFGMETCVSPRLWSPEGLPPGLPIGKLGRRRGSLRVTENLSLTYGDASAVRIYSANGVRKVCEANGSEH